MTQNSKHVIQRGEVWLANLNPNKGSEPGKVRPVLVMQHQALLESEHPSTIIVPLTTNLVDEAYPLRIRLKATEKLKENSDILVDQIRAIDNKRIIDGPLMQCGPRFMRHVSTALNEVIGNE